MFQHHQPNVENLQQYLSKENSPREGSTSWWSIPAGMSSVRILPPWDPSGRVALPVYMHPIEFQGEGMSYKKYNWTCVGKTFNKHCPICSGLSEIAASGADISNWEANRRQFYFNVLVMHDPTYKAGSNQGTAPGTHAIMKAPKTLYDWVIAQITNPMIGDITSPTNGIDIYITKEGSGLGTSYSMTLSPNGRTTIPQEYLDKITELYNLDDIFSAGFEQKQIDELVSHLKKSAGVLSNSVSSTVSQMAGYNTPSASQTPIQQSMFQNNTAQQTPPWVASPANQFNTPAPSPFSSMQTPLSNQSASAPKPQVTSPSPSTGVGATPKCFGQYNPGNVNCVVCPHELNCSKSSQ